MMSILRILYLVCWRNRLLIPLIISCATFAMVVTMFYHGSSEEPSIAHQTVLAQRHKLKLREPQKIHHRTQDNNDLRATDTDPLTQSIQTKEDPKKKSWSNIPDPDDLAKKLGVRLTRNRKNRKDEGQPGNENNENGKERVINPEQGMIEVAKDEKFRRNRPRVENQVFLQLKTDVQDARLEQSTNIKRNAEKKVNALLSDTKQGKSNDFFKVAEEVPLNLEINGDDKIVSQKDKILKVRPNEEGTQKEHVLGAGEETDVIADIKTTSLRDKYNILNKNSSYAKMELNLARNNLNGSLRTNISANLKPVVFKQGMPMSAHKHKKKVVNFDIQPHRHPKVFTPYHSKFLYRNSSAYLPDHLSDWLHDEELFCDSRLKAYHGEFAHLKNVVLDTNYTEGNKGGESILSVINQPEEDEYYQYMYGFFQLPCVKKPDYFFNNNNHINQWLFATRTTNLDDKSRVDVTDNKFTIAVVRYEYVNIYHSMTDFYNAFLMMEFFNKTQIETNILVIDGHPEGTLDGVWHILFNSSKRISQLPRRTKFTNLVWGMLGYNSPMMDHYAFKLPLVEEFRRFFLSSYHVNDSHKLSCDHLTITFIWRRDYVAHPRNPTGTVSRKIANEEELVLALHEKYPNYTVQGMQIDLFDMPDQLQTIAHSDILIGMHGAGLTHAMFLPSHGGLVELLPVYWAAANEHFEAIARWRKLLYQRWVNVDSQYEIKEHVTKVPPDVLTNMVTSIISDMCGRVTHRIYPGLGDETV